MRKPEGETSGGKKKQKGRQEPENWRTEVKKRKEKDAQGEREKRGER